MIAARDVDQIVCSLGSAGVVLWDAVDTEKTMDERIASLKQAARFVELDSIRLQAELAIAERERRES